MAAPDAIISGSSSTRVERRSITASLHMRTCVPTMLDGKSLNSSRTASARRAVYYSAHRESVNDSVSQ